MHPSRLYELFNDYVEGEKVYPRNPYFYEEWGTLASQTLLDLDDELTEIFNSLNYNTILKLHLTLKYMLKIY